MTEKTLTEVEIKLAELRRKNAQSLAKLSAAGLAMAGAIVEASEEEFFTKQELRLIRSCQRYANDDGDGYGSGDGYGDGYGSGDGYGYGDGDGYGSGHG